MSGLIYIPKSQKVVAMCRGGFCRSVAMKNVLTYQFGHSVFTCGFETNPLEHRRLLFDWADKIVVMKTEFLEHIPEEYRQKTLIYDVGADIWINPFHPDLIKKISDMVKERGEF